MGWIFINVFMLFVAFLLGAPWWILVAAGSAGLLIELADACGAEEWE